MALRFDEPITEQDLGNWESIARTGVGWEKTKVRRLIKEVRDLRAYADKLVKDLPDGLLPKDVENLREGNAALATENLHLKREIDRLHKEKVDLEQILKHIKDDENVLFCDET
jgi:regulator of replication initiation timing